MKTLRHPSLVVSLLLGSLVACSSSTESGNPAPGSSAMLPSEGMGAGESTPAIPAPMPPQDMPQDMPPGVETPELSEGGPMPVGLDNAPPPAGMTPTGSAEAPPMSMQPQTPPPVVEPPPEAPMTPALCTVGPIPDTLRDSYDLDPFYTKVALARGIPVLSSDAPVDQALTRACELLVDMLSIRQDVVDVLIQRRTIFSIIGETELTNDIPEYRNQPDTINQRARGLGGAANGTCAEESILCNRRLDRWRGEGICVHEYSHTISAAGLFRADPTFQARLRAAYQDSMASGRFANTYALESLQEYWAEGVQDWYNTNLESVPSNGVHNEIDKRAELLTYDPALYGLIAELLPANNKFQDCYADVPLPQ